jgi:restriction system protein
MLPILHALREMGGSATASEVTDAVIERENLDEELLVLTNENGQSKVRNQIAWARMYLVHSGHLDASLRGVWRLTEKGQHENLETLDVPSLSRLFRAPSKISKMKLLRKEKRDQSKPRRFVWRQKKQLFCR